MVNLKEILHGPDFFAGLCNYRGSIVPIIDLRQLIQGQPCEHRLSTRIILIDYFKPDLSLTILGLMAERVTEAVMKPKNALIPASVSMQNAPYLGGIMMEQNTMIQYIDVDRLPDSLHLLPIIEEGIEHVTGNN